MWEATSPESFDERLHDPWANWTALAQLSQGGRSSCQGSNFNPLAPRPFPRCSPSPCLLQNKEPEAREPSSSTSVTDVSHSGSSAFPRLVTARRGKAYFNAFQINESDLPLMGESNCCFFFNATVPAEGPTSIKWLDKCVISTSPLLIRWVLCVGGGAHTLQSFSMTTSESGGFCIIGDVS